MAAQQGGKVNRPTLPQLNLEVLFTPRDAPPPSEFDIRFDAVKTEANQLRIGGETIDASEKDLELGKQVGKGSYGTVNMAVYKGTPMAAKTCAKGVNDVQLKAVVSELECFTKASGGPNLIGWYGFFVTESSVIICMEPMTTCLYKLLQTTGPLPEKILGQIAVSVLKALHFLKEKPLEIMHRDVKPSNILLDGNGNVKLCDFGFAKTLIKSKAQTKYAGTALYMAPERFEIEEYDVRSDVWSYGITLVELARGKNPYDGFKGEFQISCAIMKESPPVLQAREGELRFSRDLVKFVSQLLKKKVDDRPRYHALLENPFILKAAQENYDIGAWLSAFKKPESI